MTDAGGMRDYRWAQLAILALIGLVCVSTSQCAPPQEITPTRARLEDMQIVWVAEQLTE